jgi:Rrf2 family protein
VKLSRAASYAVEALAYLAAHGEGRLVPSHEAARARGIPERFLLKILRQLGRAGLVHSVKGPRGGYHLARPAGRISLLEVVEAVDGPILTDVAEVGSGQALNRQLQVAGSQAAQSSRRVLAGVSVADLAAGKRKTRGGNRS